MCRWGIQGPAHPLISRMRLAFQGGRSSFRPGDAGRDDRPSRRGRLQAVQGNPGQFVFHVVVDAFGVLRERVFYAAVPAAQRDSASGTAQAQGTAAVAAGRLAVLRGMVVHKSHGWLGVKVAGAPRGVLMTENGTLSAMSARFRSSSTAISGLKTTRTKARLRSSTVK